MTSHALRAFDRAGRTALQALAAYLVVGGTLASVNWAVALSAAVLAAVVSLLQGLVDLPPLPGTWLGDAAGRAVRTLAQTALAGVGTAVFVGDVAWGPVLSASVLAAVGSLVTSAIAAPVGPSSVRGTPEIIGVGNVHRVQ